MRLNYHYYYRIEYDVWLFLFGQNIHKQLYKAYKIIGKGYKKTLKEIRLLKCVVLT